MPRAKCRARRRRAHLSAILDRVVHPETAKGRIDALEELEMFIRQVAASDEKVWSYLKQIVGDSQPADKFAEEEKLDLHAMVAHVVAPHIVEHTPRSVRRRLPWAE